MSSTATRLLEYPSDTYASCAAASKEIFATRPNELVLLLFTGCFDLPICTRNLPSCVNLRMCESPSPFPPIHTLSLSSTEMPWFDVGQSYPSPGPPHAFTRLP